MAKQTTATTRTEKAPALEFENLNAVGMGLEFLQARTPDELLGLLRQIKQPTKVISIYKSDNFHVMWILTSAKLIKE